MASELELEIRADVGREVLARCENQACGLKEAFSLGVLVVKPFRFACGHALQATGVCSLRREVNLIDIMRFIFFL